MHLHAVACVGRMVALWIPICPLVNVKSSNTAWLSLHYLHYQHLHRTFELGGDSGYVSVYVVWRYVARKKKKKKKIAKLIKIRKLDGIEDQSARLNSR